MTAIPYTDDELTADLDDYIAEPLFAAPDAPKDAERANYLLRRLTRITENADQVKALADAEAQRIADWKAERLGVLEREQAWIESALEGFMREAVRTGSSKTMHLPNGTLTVRAARSRVIVDDEPALIEWAKDNAPAAVKVTESVLKGQIDDVAADTRKTSQTVRDDGTEVAVCDLITDSGEVIPGVHTETPTLPTFAVKIRG